MTNQLNIPTLALAHQLINKQFPEYTHLSINEIEKQGHDNRTYRLGNELLIRMPTAESYALKVSKEQELLLRFTKNLTLDIPIPVKIGLPSIQYPYPFSIYKWLPGKSLNLITLNDQEQQQLAIDLAKFLKELQNLKDIPELLPGQHNWWRGNHIDIYDKNIRNQVKKLKNNIDNKKVLNLWERAGATKWNKPAVWVHGDFAIGNMLITKGKLSAIIDFGGTAMGDPACDLVIAWTYLTGNARKVFIEKMELDELTWLRAKAWTLWKATFELSQIKDMNSFEARQQKKIINQVIEC